jgi:regulator of PEP synthase PpsR (kinase-PPPase family)
MKKSSQVINIASKEFFQAALVTYLLLTLAETVKEGVVSNFFNMNYLLLLVLVTGVAMVLTEQEPKEQAKRFRKRVSRAVVILTIRQERREMIRHQRAKLLRQQHAQAYMSTQSKKRTRLAAARVI